MQSYSFANKLKNTIEILPYFATLLREDESNYQFQFVFKVKQSSIVQNLLSKVVIKCVNPNVVVDRNTNLKVLGTIPLKKKQVVNQIGAYEIHNIQCKHNRQIKKAVSKNNSVIAEQTVNLQNYVSPLVYNELKSGKKPNEINQLYRYKDVLEVENSNSNFNIYDLSFFDQGDIKKVNLELISLYSIHPISVVSTEEKYPNNQKASFLRSYFLTDALKDLQKDNTYYVSAKKKVIVDKLSIKVLVDVPKNLVNTNFEVHFETYKFDKKKLKLIKSEIPAERQVKTINLEKHLKFFRVPLLPATLHVHNEEIEAHQNDPNSNYIKIEKKEMSNNGMCTKYSTSYEDYVEQERSCSISEPIHENKFVILRCTSGEMSTTVINPKVSGLILGKLPYVDTHTMVLSDKLGNDDGIEIRIKDPPSFATQFKLSKKIWNGSSFDEKITVIPYKDFDGDTTTVLDQTVKNGEISEYILEYKTETGEYRQSVTQTYQYKKLKEAMNLGVRLTAPTTSIVNGKMSLRFNIETQRQMTQEDKVKDLLTQIGVPKALTDTFESVNAADKFTDLFYHKVVRTNLKTGTKEYFDELQGDSSFNTLQGTQSLRDDPESRSKNSVEDIDTTADYEYEVRTYLRNPLSLAKNFVQKIVIPPSSNRASPRIYYYKPYKWRQPSISEDGTIPAVDDLNNLLTRKFDEDGELGVTGKYTFAGLRKNISISSASSERIDLNKVRVFWSTNGNDEDFDHFVIVKEVGKVRRLVGAVVGQEFIDILNNDDVGTLIYYIVPVLYDFSAGNAVRTNTLLIDPAELDFKQQITEMF